MIIKVRSSCGCTAALVFSPEVAPGSSSEIKVIFNSSGFREKVSKYIYVESNDPDQPVSRLTITATVEAPPQPIIELLEDSWDFGLIIQGEKPTYTVSVQNTGEQDLLLSEISTSPHCTAELLSTNSVSPGKMGKIRISCDSTGHKGLMKEYLFIDTNDSFEETIVFPITGYVIEPKAELTIFPIFLDLGTIDQDEKCTAIIKLKNWGERKIKIINIDGSSQLIIVGSSSEEVDPGEETKINVTLNSGGETGQMKEYIYLTIALPLEVTIENK